MKILVTGGAGFIGSHTARALLNKEHQVVCIDNFNNYYSPKIKEKNISEFLENPLFKLYRADICDNNVLQEIFKKEKIQKVCHLAARAGVRPSIEDPHLYQEVNIKGTLNLLELSKQFEVENFVFASSSSVYGNSHKIPFSESDITDNPISPYAATKRATELLAYTYHHLYNLNCTGLRFFTVYGPSGRPDMAPFLFTKAINEGKVLKKFGDGSTKRDYTFVSDIVAGVVSAIDKNHKYEIINLGNKNPVSLNHFISVIENKLGKKANIETLPKQAGDVDITFADINKAQNLLDYSPEVSIEEGMSTFIDWYLKEKM